MNKFLDLGLKSFFIVLLVSFSSVDARRHGGYAVGAGLGGFALGTLLGSQMGGKTKTVVVEKGGTVTVDHLNQIWDRLNQFQAAVQSDLNTLQSRIEENARERESLIEKIEILTRRLEALK